MAEDIPAWFAAKIPAGWFAGPPEVTSDGDEILVLGPLPDVELAPGTSEEGRAAAPAARIGRFREEARDERVGLAPEAGREVRGQGARGGEGRGPNKGFNTPRQAGLD